MSNPCVGFGSRTFTSHIEGKLYLPNFNKIVKLYTDAAELCGEMSEAVEGGAIGADRLFKIMAHSLGVPVRTMRANWIHFGKSAGVLRNREMADYIRANEGFAIGLWDGESRGTKHMMDYCARWGIPTLVHEWNMTGKRMEMLVHKFNT